MTRRDYIDTLVFDFDGVIADTEPPHWRSWATILEPMDICFTWEQYCEIGRGVSDAQMIDKLWQLGQDRSKLTGLEERNALRKGIMQDLCKSNPPIPESTVEMLHSLKGYCLGLATSSAISDVAPLLRAAGIYQCFDALVFGNDVVRHKPAPDPYILLSDRLGVKTGLAFEDSDAGIVSAQQARFVAIHIAEPEQLSLIVYRELSERHPF